MKQCILTLAFFCTIVSAFSQQNLFYTFESYKAPYLAANIIDKGATFQVLKITRITKENYQRIKWEDNVKLLDENGLDALNQFSICEYDKASNERVSFKDYLVLPNEAIKNSAGVLNVKTLQEVYNEYPELVKLEADDIVIYQNQRAISYRFNPYFQQYFQSESKLVTCTHPERTDKQAKLGLYNNSFDALSNEVVTVYYAEKDKNDKWASNKNIEIITTSLNCDLKKKYPVSFQYPRVYDRSIAVTDINNPNKSMGHLVLFNRLNAGKAADPDKANVRIVYCTKEGKTISLNVKFREDNKGWEKIHGAFADGEKLYISYHSYGSQGEKVGIKEVDLNGQVIDHVLSKEQLQEKTNVAYGNVGQLSRSREELGMLAREPAFGWGTEEFDMQGAQRLGSKTYIWGQAVYKSADPNYKGEGMTPTIKRYAEGFFFVYGENMVLENMYILNLPNDKSPKKFNIVSTANNALEFFIPVESSDEKNYAETTIKHDEVGNKRLPNNYNRLISPLFLSVNDKLCKFQYYPGIYTLNLEQGHVNTKDGNRYIVGFEVEFGMMKEDTGETIYKNRHYLKNKQVDY